MDVMTIRTKSVIVGEMMSCEEREILYNIWYDMIFFYFKWWYLFYIIKKYARKIYS